MTDRSGYTGHPYGAEPDHLSGTLMQPRCRLVNEVGSNFLVGAGVPEGKQPAFGSLELGPNLRNLVRCQHLVSPATFLVRTHDQVTGLLRTGGL
jgi:hypothetical protein